MTLPSGSAFFTYSTAIRALAPGLFSTRTVRLGAAQGFGQHAGGNVGAAAGREADDHMNRLLDRLRQYRARQTGRSRLVAEAASKSRRLSMNPPSIP